MASMTALLAEATRSLVQSCRSGTPLLQLAEARVIRVLKAMMLTGRPWERSDVPVGLTDDMMALLKLALPCACRRGGRGPKQALQVICQARCRCCTAFTEPAVNPSAQLSFSGITTMSPAPLIQGLAHLTWQRVWLYRIHQGTLAPGQGAPVEHADVVLSMAPGLHPSATCASVARMDCF